MLTRTMPYLPATVAELAPALDGLEGSGRFQIQSHIHDENSGDACVRLR